MLDNLVCGSLLYVGGSCDFKRRQSAAMVYRSGSMSNPFIAYDDGFSWPDLYTECDEMLESCVLVYLLAELRTLVRKGEATSKTETVMQMPLPARDLMKAINGSRLLLTMEEAAGCTSIGDLGTSKTIKYCHHLLRTTDERSMRIKRQQQKSKESPKNPQDSPTSLMSSDDDYDDQAIDNANFDEHREPLISPTTYIEFDDHFQSEELTYAIGVNHMRRRITLCFRGSVVSNVDWATDFDAYMKEVKNPMKMHSSQQPTMKIHSKLHHLLYAKASQKNVNENANDGGDGTVSEGEDVWTEFMDILKNKVQPATINYPGYKLYVTGYSQGGALATLFAFLAAAEPDAIIPKPVTCVSIASPYVGDDSFRLAHQMLEGLGKLRHLRVSNHKDLVTASPKMSFRWGFPNKMEDGGGHVGSLFKHVGMNLRLFQHDKTAATREAGMPPNHFEISYPKVRSGFFMTHYFDEMSRGWDQSPFTNLSCNPMEYLTWPWHNIREYNKRLSKNKEALQRMSLNELYSRKDIVGNLGSQF